MNKRIVAALLLAVCSLAAEALTLPEPTALQRRMGKAPQVVTVVEPHLMVDGQQPQIAYRGFPARVVLARYLGAHWARDREREIEFRALDGFVSRIPVARLLSHPAWLVFERADGQPFEVDNKLQGERAVPLGPYYLVWDNIAAPELIKEGGALWPYQVAAFSSQPSSRQALLPAGLKPDPESWADAAALAQKFCLACHRVHGFGGDKMPLDLAERARRIDAASWRRWLLTPAEVRPGTSMPALPDTLPLAEREEIAERLHRYLNALPAETAARRGR